MPGGTLHRLPILSVLALAGCAALEPPELLPGLVPPEDPGQTRVVEAIIRDRAPRVALAIVRRGEDGVERLESVPASRREPWIRAFGRRFGSLVFLSPFLAREATASPSGLRSDAARLAADTLLVVAYGHDSASRPNLLSLAYPTLIGAFLVPGTNCSNLTACRMAFIDVEKGTLLYHHEDRQSIRTSASLVGAAATQRRIAAMGRDLVLDRSLRRLESLLLEAEQRK